MGFIIYDDNIPESPNKMFVRVFMLCMKCQDPGGSLTYV